MSKFMEDFVESIGEDGNTFSFFSSGDDERDEWAIKEMLNVQGFWSGVKYRYFFDKELIAKGVVELTKVEERRFG